MKWILCLIIGHKWERYGFPTRDDDCDKDDIQMFRCRRCWAMPVVEHFGTLPRFIKPIHKTKASE